MLNKIKQIFNKDKRISLDNWTKDYATGEFKQQVKIKPVTGMKGKAHIEVFDKDGKLKQEAVTENVINDSINKNLNKYVLNNIYGGSTTYSPYYNLNMFGRLIATNYTGAEDATMDRLPSPETYESVAFCHRTLTYTGSDTKRGSINNAETSFNPDTGEMSIVMDWPTHAGNGTFQSLFWVLNGTTVSNAEAYTDLYSSKFSSDSNSDHFRNSHPSACIVGDWYYYVHYNTYDIYRLPRATSGLKGFIAYEYQAEPVLTSGAVSYYGVQHDGTYFYVLVNNPAYTIEKYDESWTLQDSFVVDSSYFTNFAFTVLDSHLYTFRRTTAGDFTIRKIDMTGTVQNTWNILRQTDIYPPLIGNDGNDIYIIGGTTNTIAKLDTSGNFDVYQTNNSPVATYNHYPYRIAFDPYTRYWFSGTYYSSGNDSNIDTISFDVAPSAHTLLASPVTKTDSDTMKITYTFTMDMTKV